MSISIVINPPVVGHQFDLSAAAQPFKVITVQSIHKRPGILAEEISPEVPMVIELDNGIMKASVTIKDTNGNGFQARLIMSVDSTTKVGVLDSFVTLMIGEDGNPIENTLTSQNTGISLKLTFE